MTMSESAGDKEAEMSQEESRQYVLKTENLTKTYGNHRAVNSVSMHVRKGDIYGFIGKTVRVSPLL